jgi:signal transduction histidine kinase
MQRYKASADLITHFQRVVERENERVAKLLHDELGGLIVAAIMDIAWSESHMKSDGAGALTKLSRARQALRAAIDIERKLIDELRPTLLDDVGLFAALRWQLKKTWGATGVIYTDKYPAIELRLRPDVSIGLFRIAQEALQISLQHELVKSASLTVTVNRDRLFMRFVDDGIAPTPVNPLEGSGNNLTSMRNRLRILGGRVQITERAGGGTMLLATVPLGTASLAMLPALPDLKRYLPAPQCQTLIRPT